MSTFSTAGSGSTSSSNSPPGNQEIVPMGIEQMLLGINFQQQATTVPMAAPVNAQLQFLEALAQTGLLSQIGAMKGGDLISQMGARPFANSAPNNNNNGMEAAHGTAAENVPMPQMCRSGQRKRRRMVGNLDNTLDGLVAKRADNTAPMKGRYQTETEAIELPDDELEIKRMEADPDVCTRMCSVCGYQGKWVSEMIRHKRVHTNDRPFKCKYCNRTSKWKADLIRHVAKTHGIRVVSKYSRSKAFELGGRHDGDGAKNVAGSGEVLSADDVILLDSSSFSSSSSSAGGSDYGGSSGGGHSSQQGDENNNHIDGGTGNGGTGTGGGGNEAGIGGGMKADALSSDASLNSLLRKAQRLSNLNRNGTGAAVNNNNNGIDKKEQQPASLLDLLGGTNQQHQLSAMGRQQQQIPPLNGQKGQSASNVYKCVVCPYEEASFPVLVSHLHSVHGIFPFVCQVCARPFNELVTASQHFTNGQCPPLALKPNFVVVKKDAEQPAGMGLNRPPMPLPSLPKLASTFPPAANPFAAAISGLLFPAFPFATARCPATLLTPSAQFNSQSTMVGQQTPVGSEGPNCGSPASVLSLAPSYGSMASLVAEEKQPQNGAPNEGNEADEEENMRERSGSEELEEQKQQQNVVPIHAGCQFTTKGMLDLKLNAAIKQIGDSLGCSAFTPVGATQQQNQNQHFGTAASLTAFAQFLAELQRRSTHPQSS